MSHKEVRFYPINDTQSLKDFKQAQRQKPRLAQEEEEREVKILKSKRTLRQLSDIIIKTNRSGEVRSLAE